MAIHRSPRFERAGGSRSVDSRRSHFSRSFHLKRRVVVTGLGLVTPVGNSVETTWAALAAGKSGADDIKKFDTAKFSVRFACEVKDFNPLDYVEKKEARKMGAFIHYAIAASQEAVDDSG